jgi:hypothetical protein
MAINAYPPGDGIFDSTPDLAAPEFAAANVKGTVHEFGHALGLPHIGPRPGLKLGNSLMGPVNRAFWGKSGTDDTRVYLSEVSAAMLWRHPLFQPDATATPEQPDDLEVKGLIVISGQLVSGQSAHSAVLLDSERGRFGDYWARPYSSSIDQQAGRFSITIAEPFRSGTAYLSFSFKNGLTSDGDKSFQRGSKLEVTYQGEPGSGKDHFAIAHNPASVIGGIEVTLLRHAVVGDTVPADTLEEAIEMKPTFCIFVQKEIDPAGMGNGHLEHPNSPHRVRSSLRLVA